MQKTTRYGLGFIVLCAVAVRVLFMGAPWCSKEAQRFRQQVDEFEAPKGTVQIGETYRTNCGFYSSKVFKYDHSERRRPINYGIGLQRNLSPERSGLRSAYFITQSWTYSWYSEDEEIEAKTKVVKRHGVALEDITDEVYVTIWNGCFV